MSETLRRICRRRFEIGFDIYPCQNDVHNRHVGCTATASNLVSDSLSTQTAEQNCGRPVRMPLCNLHRIAFLAPRVEEQMGACLPPLFFFLCSTHLGGTQATENQGRRVFPFHHFFTRNKNKNDAVSHPPVFEKNVSPQIKSLQQQNLYLSLLLSFTIRSPQNIDMPSLYDITVTPKRRPKNTGA